jgi:hypothetical protein
MRSKQKFEFETDEEKLKSLEVADNSVNEDKQRLLDRGPSALKTLRVLRENEMLGRLFFLEDIFHTLLDLSNWKVCFVAYVMYNIVLIFFAILYYMIAHTGRNCHTDFKTFMQSMFFSLQTFTSIGFGASDPYFDGCSSMYFVIAWESYTVIIINAFAIGVFYARFARSQERAATVIFSKKAIVAYTQDSIRFMFRICDYKKTHLLDAHVRCFAVKHAQDASGGHYKGTQLKLLHPDDDLGGMLLLALPSQVTHEICSKDVPNETSPLAPAVEDISKLTFEQIQQHWKDLDLEIVVLVQGVEPLTSHNTQARYSYKVQDLVWQHQFVPIVEPIRNHRYFNCRIDFDKFDEMVELRGRADSVDDAKL